jgi:hypothetical protein
MGGRRRPFVLLGVLTGAFASAMLLGIVGGASADIGELEVEACAGKPLCVTITDQVQASISPLPLDASTNHYTTDSVVVENSGSTSKLVNLAVTITWADEGTDDNDDPIATTSDFVADFSDQSGETCVKTAPQTLTCTTPKSVGPGEEIVYDPLVFRTATDDDASAFTLTVRASAKEQTNPKQKGGTDPNDAVVELSNSVTYEGDPDHDVSIAGGGIATTLGTSTADIQFSRLPVPPNASSHKQFFTLTEGSCSGKTTCLGETVTTVTHGQSPVNLLITYTGGLSPGMTTSNIVVIHSYNGTEDTIDTACSGALYSGQPPMSEIEPKGCRRVSFTRLPGGIVKVELDVWAPQNGDWRWG